MGNPTTPARQQRRRRAIRHRLIAAAAAVIVGTGTGVGIAKAQASGGPGYRTAVATIGDATRTLTVSGTVEPVNQAQASFQVSGTVSAVDVKVGQHVNAGQTLATLDSTSLQNQVSLAQANLSSAEAKLSQDESGQTSTAASSSTGTAAQSTGAAQTTAAQVGSTTYATDAVLTAAALPSGTPSLQQAQQAVVTAQHGADVDIQTAAAKLASAQTTCQTITGGTQPGGSTSTSPSGQTSTTTTTTPSAPTTTTTVPSTTTTSPSTTTTTAPSSTTTTPSATDSGGSSAASACASALDEAMAAEQQVSRDQQAVQSAEKALAQILSGQMSSGSGNTNSSSGSPKSTGTSSSGTATATNSAAQLASDQASIDTDQATLVSAQQSLQNANLTAPIAGTVATVNIAVGQTPSVGSTSYSITITNPGTYQTVSSLTTSQVGQVNVGDSVQVTVDGQSSPIAGTVSRVGPVQASSSSYTYPLIVSLDPPPPTTTSMPAGSAGQAQVQTARANHAVVVPTSAVHTTTAGNSYVMMLQGANEVRKPVTVGVVGQTYTQITSGLAAGTVVVLADPSQTVPSSSTNSNTFRLGGTGGAGFPSGFPSGGFQRFGTGGGG